MRVSKTIVLISIFFIACSSLLSGCKSSNKSKEVVEMGVVLPLTGSLSVMGEVEKNAMRLAEEEINKDQRKIELIIEDGKGTQSGAASAANKLVNINNVDVLITSTTGASLTAKPIAAENKKNLVAFCMDPTVAHNSPYVTRYYIGINEEAEAINEYFRKSANKSKVGILHARVPVFEKVINNNYVETLKNTNNELVYRESYEIGETDFRNLILKLRNSEADHFILLGYGFAYPNIFKELKANNLLDKMTILGGWGFLYTDVNKELLDGVLVSGPEYVFKDKKLAGEFYQKYQDKYSESPNFDAAFAYNVIKSLGNFNKNDFQSPIKDTLTSVNEFSGVVGNYYFSSSGEMIVNTGLGIIREGKIQSFDHSE